MVSSDGPKPCTASQSFEVPPTPGCLPPWSPILVISLRLRPVQRRRDKLPGSRLSPASADGRLCEVTNSRFVEAKQEKRCLAVRLL